MVAYGSERLRYLIYSPAAFGSSFPMSDTKCRRTFCVVCSAVCPDIHPQPEVEPVRADVDALDQKCHDACLLGREKLVPQRIELLQGCACIDLSDIVGVSAGSLPCPRHDLGLAEHGAKLVDDGSLDLACGHAAHRA